MKLGIINMQMKGRVHVDANNNDCSAILVQGTGDGYRIIAMGGRSLTPTEKACP